jgi:hypothetical protein
MPKSATSDATVVLGLYVVVFLAFIIAPDPTISAIEYTVTSVVSCWNTLNAAIQYLMLTVCQAIGLLLPEVVISWWGQFSSLFDDLWLLVHNSRAIRTGLFK